MGLQLLVGGIIAGAVSAGVILLLVVLTTRVLRVDLRDSRCLCGLLLGLFGGVGGGLGWFVAAHVLPGLR